MELNNLWIFLTIIVLLNLTFGGLFSIILLVLVLFCSYAISKLCLTSNNQSLIRQIIWSGLMETFNGPGRGHSKGLKDRLERERILKFLISREKDETNFCLTCQERRCLRHGSEVKVGLFPERRILINSCLNQLLMENINLCLEDVDSLKNNETLCLEVRRCISFVIGNLITRMRINVNSTDFISKRLSTSIVQHLYFFLAGKRQSRSAYFIKEQVIKVYQEKGYYCDSNHLHSMVKACHHLIISPTLLSNSTLALFSLELIVNCVLEPFLDLIANPYYFNTLIIVLLEGISNVNSINCKSADNHHHHDESNNLPSSSSSSPSLLLSSSSSLSHEHNQQQSTSKMDSLDQLLDNFSKPLKQLNGEDNCLGLSLKEIIKDEQLLFIFMQYLKEEGAVNLLQFLLSVDAFNCRLLKPDLIEEEKIDLTKELELLWKEYFAEESGDYIHFHDETIRKSLEEIIIEKKEIVLLQKSDPLYKAYDQVYNTIDRVYLPLFTESSLYFKLIAGSRINQSASFDTNDGDNLSLSSQISSIPESSRKNFNPSGGDDGSRDSIKEEDEIKAKEDIQVIHDLSSWQVKVDRVEKRVKSEFDDEEIADDEEDRLIFAIKVDDVKGESNWEIQREFDEFHVLQSKLRQFHGTIKGIDIQLPKKRFNLLSSCSYFPVTQTNISFLEGHMGDLQNFLETLLANPALQFSSLLHSFLKPSASSNQFNSTSVDFRKMMRNLNSTFSLKGGTDLRTSLQPFILNFLGSTENKRNPIDTNKETPPPPPTPTSTINSQGIKSNSNSFEDALDPIEISTINETISNTNDTNTTMDIGDGQGNTLYELIMFIMNSIYDLDETNSTAYYLLQLIEPIAKESIQSVMTKLLELELSHVVTLENCVLALETLKETLIARKSPRDVGEEEKLRKLREREALKAIQAKLNYIPFTPSSLSFHLYYCFQFPSLNKQFLYLILNQLFLLLFPEIFPPNN
ncbi:sorting nexin-14-like [Panonychus citri]|uniref:sorting nexin-14-like n=1 Tax=Panonychus citri TaxID=50023 RepID=UPI0023071C5E|nr:sorting nexin-14-like [Panonychus citri]XP_053202167.1 sorting nexin-14-like [Panonychus citri]